MITRTVYMLCEPAIAYSLFVGKAARWWSPDRVRAFEPPGYLEVDLRMYDDDVPSIVRVNFTEEVRGTRITLRDESRRAYHNAPLWEERLHKLKDELSMEP